MNQLEQLKREGNLLAKPVRPKKPKKGLRRASKKRMGANREYALRRRAFLLKHKWCEAHGIICTWLSIHDLNAWGKAPCGFDGHGPESEEIHHKRKPRSKYLNDESTWLAVAKWSHAWIEGHKDIARQLGLLENV